MGTVKSAKLKNPRPTPHPLWRLNPQDYKKRSTFEKFIVGISKTETDLERCRQIAGRE